MVAPELNCCALDSFRLFTVSSPQIEEDPNKYKPPYEFSTHIGAAGLDNHISLFQGAMLRTNHGP